MTEWINKAKLLEALKARALWDIIGVINRGDFDADVSEMTSEIRVRLKEIIQQSDLIYDPWFEQLAVEIGPLDRFFGDLSRERILKWSVAQENSFTVAAVCMYLGARDILAARRMSPADLQKEGFVKYTRPEDDKVIFLLSPEPQSDKIRLYVSFYEAGTFSIEAKKEELETLYKQLGNFLGEKP